MKPTYTEHWRCSRALARHMWRFFCKNRSPTVDDMSMAAYNAWSACNTVWNRLKPMEKEIVMVYHTAPIERCQAEIESYASRNGFTVPYVLRIVSYAWKEAAIERGIADRE